MSNTDYSITYKRKLSESYQVVTFEKGRLKIHELEMLRRNRLGGFLPIEFMLADGRGQFWYNITGLQSLDDLRKTGRFQAEALKILVEGLEKALKTAESYMLREESIRLDDIFFSPDRTKVYFSYLPLKMEEQQSAKEKLLQLVDSLIKTADYRENEYVTYLFSLYDVLGQENAGMEALLDIPIRKAECGLKQEEPVIFEAESQEKDFMTQTEEQEEGLPEKEISSCRKSVSDRIKEKIKNKYLDEVWSVKKKLRRYAKIKPEKWEDVTVIRPQERPEENRNTQYLGPERDLSCATENSLKKESQRAGKSNEPSGRIRFEDPGKGSLSLTQQRYVVGKRKEYANLVVEDASVSRVHALIVREEDGYYLEDLNSLNGTFLNGTMLELKEKVRLKSRDEIGVGNSTLIFEET